MDTPEQTPVHEDNHASENLEPSPVQEEYAPVIFAQDTVSHVISLDMLSGKVNSFFFISLSVYLDSINYQLFIRFD